MFECRHTELIKDVIPDSPGCGECLKIGLRVGPSSALQILRPSWLLRCLAKPSCDRAFSGHRASHHRRLRPTRGVGLVLHRRGLHRPWRENHCAADKARREIGLADRNVQWIYGGPPGHNNVERGSMSAFAIRYRSVDLGEVQMFYRESRKHFIARPVAPPWISRHPATCFATSSRNWPTSIRVVAPDLPGSDTRKRRRAAITPTHSAISTKRSARSSKRSGYSGLPC